MRIRRNYGVNKLPLNYVGLADRSGFSNARSGQKSAILRRKVSQWTNGDSRGNFVIDILPPELRARPTPRRYTPIEAAKPIVNEQLYCDHNNQPLSIGIVSQLVLKRPPGKRTYLLIVNTHATQVMYVRFGANADLLSGLPIPGNYGSYELNNVVHQGDVYIVASGALTTGVLIYANKEDA